MKSSSSIEKGDSTRVVRPIEEVGRRSGLGPIENLENREVGKNEELLTKRDRADPYASNTGIDRKELLRQSGPF